MMQLQLAVQGHVQEIIRRAVGQGRELDSLFVIVDTTPDGSQAFIGACDADALRRAWDTYSDRFREATTELLAMKRMHGWVHMLYFTPEEWCTARLLVPPALLVSAAGGQA